MQRMPQREHDRAARERDARCTRGERAEQYPRIEVPDGIGIVGAVQRHVTHPERAKTERVGQRRKLDLLAKVRDDLARAQQGQRQPDRQMAF